MIRILGAVLALVLLGACAQTGVEQGAPPDDLEIVAYRNAGPAEITLITVINNRTGAGGHTSLMVSGSQRVIFDPAGSFRPDWVQEYGDVLYGISPSYLRAYKSAHARASHHVVTQTIRVSPAVAQRALALVQANGSVGSAYCANATSGILRQLPGFEDIQVTFYPVQLKDQFAARSGVVTDSYFEDDAGNVVDGIAVAAPEVLAAGSE